MEWNGCGRCEKSQRDFVARACTLIAPVHTVLHRVSWSYETVPNAPKHYATHQNMSLGSNVVDWMRSLQKIPVWLRGTSFCFNGTSSPHFAPSFMQLRNDNKCTQICVNGPMEWIGCVRCEKSRHDFVAPVYPVLHRVSCSYKKIINAPKHYATHQNMSLGSNGVDWVRSLQKITTWLHGTNFCINCTSSPRFTPSLMQLWNYSKMQPNTIQHTKTWV